MEIFDEGFNGLCFIRNKIKFLWHNTFVSIGDGGKWDIPKSILVVSESFQNRLEILKTLSIVLSSNM